MHNDEPVKPPVKIKRRRKVKTLAQVMAEERIQVRV
jgi:hypothetical protein